MHYCMQPKCSSMLISWHNRSYSLQISYAQYATNKEVGKLLLKNRPITYFGSFPQSYFLTTENHPLLRESNPFIYAMSYYGFKPIKLFVKQM